MTSYTNSGSYQNRFYRFIDSAKFIHFFLKNDIKLVVYYTRYGVRHNNIHLPLLSFQQSSPYQQIYNYIVK